MPIDPAYPYDVFLSYSRQDVEWASRLSAKLKDRGLKVFRDEERLKAGGPWNDQLVEALARSRQLVELYSDAARDSDWVRKEVEYFHAVRRATRAASGVGYPIAVILDGHWAPHDPYQNVDDIKLCNAYAAGAAALPEAVWLDVVRKVEAGIRVHDVRRAVPVVVLTTTQRRLAALDADARQGRGLSLSELATELGLTCDAVLDRYGERRLDWQPFGEQGIGVLLEALQDEINLTARRHGAPEVRWEYPDEAGLWDVSAADARDNVARLESGPCLIVLDPIAFYDEDVKRWFDNVLTKPLLNPDALVLVPSPADPATALLLRKRLEEVAFRAYEGFYEPSLRPGMRYARTALHVADRRDLKGWLLTGLRPVLTSEHERSASLYTQIVERSS